uniref:Uncharacterized protein n=1 Tax=Candidatus Giovannonibacteria bacterium GW2011_GWF2_42_19 TaxID=1618659 RepID=A0A0G0ZJQ4_9BACT|nr:MAG: hypothetical protein UV11_C0001G0070 [Candidatus Giovannonibacteria bacterium GW2011_GWF2_42_19]
MISSLKNLENFFIISITISFFLIHNFVLDNFSGLTMPVFYFFLRPILFASLGIILLAQAIKALRKGQKDIKKPPGVKEYAFTLGDTSDEIEKIIATKEKTTMEVMDCEKKFLESNT